MSSNVTFTIEQLREFMSENDIQRNIIYYQLGLPMPVSDYVSAFEHWCRTGENVIGEWDDIQELIVFTEKSVHNDEVKIGSDIQFISENILDRSRKVLNGRTFWNVEQILQQHRITVQDCVAFVNEASRLKQEEKEYFARKQKAQEDKIKREQEQRTKAGTIYIVSNGRKYKIGKTTNVMQRLKGLQTSSAEVLEVVLECEIEGYNIIEKLIHERYAHKRVSGEWFDLEVQDLEDIAKFLETCKRAT